MDIPKHLWRFPTREAIDSLAQRFGLPNEPNMQDWEYEVADPDRVEEFLEAYESGELNDDECFTLMETIIESFEELKTDLDLDARWRRILSALERRITRHIYSVYYWSCIENESEEDCWRVTPYMRQILAKYRQDERFIEKPERTGAEQS